MVTCTGHIGIHEGADGRTGGRCTYGHSRRHGYKTKFSHIDGLPYFLTMVLQARAPSARIRLDFDSLFTLGIRQRKFFPLSRTVYTCRKEIRLSNFLEVSRL